MLHGVLLFIAIAVACGLAAVGVSAVRIGRSFVIGLLLAIVVGLLMALSLPDQAYTYVGENALPGIEPGVRPLVVGMIIVGAIGLIVGIIAAARGGDLGALLAGLVAGIVIGAISATTPALPGRRRHRVAVGYVMWIALMIADVATTGVDVDALKARFTPTQTIETSKETLAWLQSKMPPGTGS